MPRKEYYEKNKERLSEEKKEYYKNNKEKITLTNYKWLENNKTKIEEYKNTENYKKSVKISMWKFLGVKCDDFPSLYDRYLNCKNCEECGKEGITGHNKMLDHNHKTGEFRNILCNSCNQKRGFIDRNLN